MLSVALGLSWVSQRARHAGKRGQVNNRVHVAAQARALSFVGDVSFIKRKIRVRRQRLTRAGGKIVHAKYGVASRQQRGTKVAAYETGRAGNKDGASVHAASIDSNAAAPNVACGGGVLAIC